MKSQASFEFLSMLVVVIIIAAAFALFASDRMKEINSGQTNSELRGIASTVKNEIDIASSMEQGYERAFELPLAAGSKNYSISLEGSFIVVSADDGSFALPVQPVLGTLNQGMNRITNLNGSVVING
ncbi:hypothetical protein HYX10_00120 [Candidatus Woesearchaeota archaeon]|nr:hypothetical protein [Candidatus Woesearchaeota archaeon]